MKVNLTNANLILAQLEEEIAENIGMQYAVVCTSARSAIRFSLLALRIRHGDEILIPDLVPEELPMTVFCTGGIPRFCDVDRRTCAMSLKSFQGSLRPKTRAVIFSYLYGLPGDPLLMKEITDGKGIALIEDASQALGVSIRGRKAGSFGNVGILNFHKFLNVNTGAAITTNDQELAAKIRLIREKYETTSLFASLGYHMMELTGLSAKEIMTLVFLGDKYLYKLMHETLAKKYFREVDGWMEVNSDVSELWHSNSLTPTIINQLIAHPDGRYWHRRKLEKMEILLLTKELENWEEGLQSRIEAAKMYDEHLKPGMFEKILVPANSICSYFKYPILFSEKTHLSKCIEELRKAGFKVDFRYRPLHTSRFFRAARDSDFKESLYLWEHLLPLPTTSNTKRARPRRNMTKEEIEKVASIVNSVS